VQDAISIVGCPPELVIRVYTVGHQSACHSGKTVGVDCRQAVSGGEGGDGFAIDNSEGAQQD
jgi:hypothetical protein